MKPELLTTLIATIGSLTGAAIGASSSLLAAKFQAGRTARISRNEKVIDSVRSTVGELRGVGMVYAMHYRDMITDVAKEAQDRAPDFGDHDEVKTFMNQEVERRFRGQISDAMLTFQSSLSYLQLLVADIDDSSLRLCEQAKRLVTLKGNELYECRKQL